jgi:hypothetical protein
LSLKVGEISERERMIIESVAKKIIDMELEGPAIWILQTIKPLSVIGGELAYFYLAPFLPLLDEKGYEFLDIFEKRENIERLIKTIEKMTKDKGRNVGENSSRKKIIDGFRTFFIKLKKFLYFS